MRETFIEPQKSVQDLTDGTGYTVLENLISASQADVIRNRVLDRLDEARNMGKGVLGMTNLVTWGAEFEALATNPGLLAVAHELLGKDAALSAFSARILNPGCEPGGLHVDYPYWAMNPGMPVAPALMMQVIWMMEPFTRENGGTWVAPGSQLWGGPLEEARFKESAIQATGSAGDAIISHGKLWHRTANNQSDNPRVAILLNYTQLTVKPMSPLGPFDDEYAQNASAELRTLLALNYGESLRDRLSNMK